MTQVKDHFLAEKFGIAPERAEVIQQKLASFFDKPGTSPVEVAPKLPELFEGTELQYANFLLGGFNSFVTGEGKKRVRKYIGDSANYEDSVSKVLGISRERDLELEKIFCDILNDESIDRKSTEINLLIEKIWNPERLEESKKEIAWLSYQFGAYREKKTPHQSLTGSRSGSALLDLLFSMSED